MADIRVPTLGESVTEATIGRWFKQAGEAVAVDEPLVELETDKVTIEVPAPAAGVLADIAAKDGDVHFWEFNSHTADGQPVDASKRLAISKQLTQDKDAETIKNYSDPKWVLGGDWDPHTAPIFSQLQK